MIARRLICTSLAHARRSMSSGSGPAPHSGSNDNSSFFQLLAMSGVIGVSVYIYQDPDVLPEPIRKFLPIKGVEGKNMTLEEYEVWRASQSVPSGAPAITGEKKKEAVVVVTATEPDIDPTEVVSPHTTTQETVESLTQALELARANESTFIAELKTTKAPHSDEDKEMLQAFRNEKARIKKQLKALSV
ncbi:hypothetical protein H310_01982 [Aphanomyces invadans]|uniref:Uncharacterized protein n=1 Tax=Aphanomyces invadans TaxID=157072 RepID=A0A024UNR0_9STRA|nr:hypothetical protein H310_01982 [Aphanomyces invadans]ETW07472.1 hypothetical protein H310_01982 [Aphanomyces invadans]|eukprot:XP_008863565.1 hypothetical protein H310_01982 [Aphanomyces invadans]